jgi:ketopantoate reductase
VLDFAASKGENFDEESGDGCWGGGFLQIAYERIDSYLEHSRKNLRELKTSTQQDLELGKRLEYEALAGAVVRTARRHHFQVVPAMEAVYALLKLLDGAGPRSSGAQRRSDSVKLRKFRGPALSLFELPVAEQIVP